MTELSKASRENISYFEIDTKLRYAQSCKASFARTTNWSRYPQELKSQI